jgi:hypothetical protein
VWVFEKSFGGPRFVTDGLARARERWDAALRERQVSRRYVHAVQPNTWRSGYFGPKWVRAPRDEIRQHEMMTARAEVGRVIELGADEAAAICISHWASRADSVAALLGRPTLSDM